MVKLHFKGLSVLQDTEIGPAEAFSVARNFIRASPSNEQVAAYRHHQWQVGERHHSRFDCSTPCVYYFDDLRGGETERFGPFERLWFADGSLYAEDVLKAKFVDETLLWHCMDLENYWPNLILTSP